MVDQKKLLKEYINNLSNSNNLREYINEEYKKVHKVLKELIKEVDNKVTKIKLRETIKKLTPIKSSMTIKDNQVVSLMRFYEALLRRLDVSKLRIKDSLKNINEIDQVVNEGRYHDFRNNEELTPRQKIGHSVREVRSKLTELSKLIDMNVRLKNELGVNSDQYWKNTHKN